MVGAVVRFLLSNHKVPSKVGGGGGVSSFETIKEVEFKNGGPILMKFIRVSRHHFITEIFKDLKLFSLLSIYFETLLLLTQIS